MNAAPQRSRAAQPARAQAWILALGVAGLAAATRFPLIANVPGEADSARFLIGLEQWRRFGPRGHFIYGVVFSPGYYWLAAHWMRWWGEPLARAGVALAWLSALAAVLSAPLIYYLGRRCLPARAAAATAAVFLLTPGYWWLGIEAHPQQLSILLLLAALALVGWGLERRRPRARMGTLVAAAVVWALALLVKSDAVLLAPALVVLAITAGRGVRAWPARALAGTAVAAGGAGLFVLLRQALLGASVGAAQATAGRVLAQFWAWPGPRAAARQAAPILFAAGPVIWLWVLAGGALAWAAARRRGSARGFAARRGLGPLGLLAAAWALPLYGFWWLIRGNNARHVALAILPLLWLAGWGWEAWFRRRLLPAGRLALLTGLMVLALVVLNAEAVPASSNITLFPSGNVPASAAMLRAKETVMRGWAARIEQSDGCYFGRYTPPYLIADLLAADPRAQLGRAGAAAAVAEGRREARFFTIATPAQIGAVRRACPGAVSLEYNRAGHHQRFLGSEWRGLPLAGRFY
ncbi:MAG: glycosyltransferase family 39 protein [Terriglobales bacterium]